MSMTPRLTKLALTAHVSCSVGWLGAVAAFLVLSIAGLTSHDAELVRGSYLSMNLIGLYMIVPLSLAALTTGLIQSLGTEWGLFRHYWVLTKFTLTFGSTGLLLLHQFKEVETAARRVSAAAPGVLPEIGGLATELMSKAALALFVLLVVTTLSVFKPWGLTPYGRRKRQDRLLGTPLGAASTLRDSAIDADAGLPLGFKLFAIASAIVIAVFGLLHHLSNSGGPTHHGHRSHFLTESMVFGQYVELAPNGPPHSCVWGNWSAWPKSVPTGNRPDRFESLGPSDASVRWN